MIGRPAIIAAPDNSGGLETILADYCGTFGNNCTRKKEAKINESDYAKDILIALSAGTRNGWICNSRTF